VNVKKLIRHRLKYKSLPNNREDKFHLALVIEAGGIRASSVGGMAQALSKVDFVFDSVHGSSAGACVASYFATKQTDIGESIFVDHLPQKSIMSLKKVFEVPSIVDVDTIVDKIMRDDAPLDVSDIFNKQPYLNIVATNRATGKPETIKTFKNEEEIFNALRASLRVPGPFEKGVAINENYYLDGGYSSPVSIKSTEDIGATHILILYAQRPQDYSYIALVKSIPEFFFMLAFHGLNFAIGYIKGMLSYTKAYNQDKSKLRKVDKIVRSKNGVRCGLITTNKNKIKRSWNEGVEAAECFLDNL